MPWVRIDDHFDEHPKLAAAGPLAWALWFAGLAYCNRNMTDGFIPWAIAGGLVSWDYLDAIGPTRIYIGQRDGVSDEGAVSSDYVISLLVDAGLWTQERAGYRVHDYADFQPTKAQILAEREAKVAAGRAGGIAAAVARAQADKPADAVADGVAQSKPVPKPVPVPVSVPQPESAPRTMDETENDPLQVDEGEYAVLDWLRAHKCMIREGDGYHQRLIHAVDRHGFKALIAEFERLSKAGTRDGDLKGFLFVGVDALDKASRPKLADLEEQDRKAERDADWQRRLEATKRRSAELRGEAT